MEDNTPQSSEEQAPAPQVETSETPVTSESTEFAAPEGWEAPAEETPSFTPDSEDDPAVQQWIKSAQSMGYESRLSEGESLYDYYRSLKGLDPVDTTQSETEAVVPGDETPVSDTNLEIPDSDSEETTPLPTTSISQEMWTEMSASAIETGQIADDHREAIKKSWLVDDEVIDVYLEGLQARQRKSRSDAASVVGGEESLSTILNWAAKNFSSDKRSEMNQALRGPSRDYVLKGLKAEYEAANPTRTAKASEPKLSTSSKAPASGSAIKPFTSREEMIAHINDPRYKADSAYRDWVSQRIQAS